MNCQTSPQLRTKACDLAQANWVAAVALADQIPDPWYACQAYAWCGRFAPASESSAFIRESLRRANAGKDAYQRLAATAWPLRAMIERGLAQHAAAEFDNVAPLVTQVEPRPSRAEACFLVFEAVSVGPRELAASALRWLLTALQPPRHWREHRAVRESVIASVTVELIEPGDVSGLVPDERLAANVTARLSRGDRRKPRAFFWPRGQSAGI